MPKLTPHVFLSATRNDLEPYRAAAKKAILDAACFPVTMEHFPAENSAPLDVCMREVDNADVVVAIVAHRYGWIPPRQTLGITQLECQRARETKKQVLAFVIDENQPWPPKQIEHARAAELEAFKAWLGQGNRVLFTTPDQLHGAVLHVIEHWKATPEFATQVRPREGDTARYFSWLRESTRWIELRGLKTGSANASRFEIERLYVPLTASGMSVPLEQALADRLVVIQGNAGSGKTTFLRRLALELSRPEAPQLRLPFQGFPIFIRISDLDQHMTNCRAADAPTVKESPQWIRHYLAAQNWDLDARFFEARMREPDTAVLLDGLDEAGNDQRRAAMARMFVKATAEYPCRFVVTTRPQAYKEDALLNGWSTLFIDKLDDKGVDEFLRLWSLCLKDRNTVEAEAHQKELRKALDAKPEIKRMARNPVMLTALAVVHWNDKRMPEQRAELYESVLGWLSKAREQREGRESAENCLRLLGRLALGMQEWPDGQRLQIGKDAAAKLINPHDLDRMRRFLDSEEVDSGIISSVGSEIRFWHRTLQEYLAARTLAGLPDTELWPRVTEGGRLHRSEWREVMLLLGGLVQSRGRERLDWLFDRMLSGTPDKLPDQARCVGLVGSMLRDLAPVGYELEGGNAKRYAAMREAVLAIFTVEGAAKVHYKDRVEAAEALGQAGDPRLRMPSDRDYWVEIPGAGFKIGRFPVTVWEYGKYLDATGANVPPYWDEQSQHPNRPVTRVDYRDATAYCGWADCRLPTEQEWQRAAEGVEKQEYPWGNDEPDEDRLNAVHNLGSPSPVGAFPRGNTPDRVADMGGNVWEWTGNLALRGGSWRFNRDIARCANRSLDHPSLRNEDIGFRCVKDLTPAKDSSAPPPPESR